MDYNQIDTVINEMLSEISENREQAQSVYMEMVSKVPWDIIYFHFQFILINIQNNIRVKRGLTLLYVILKNSEIYLLLNPEQNQYIQTNLLQLISSPYLDESNRGHLIDTIELAQRQYNQNEVIESGEPLWPGVFQSCIEFSLSENQLISYSGIELISRFIQFGSFNVQNNFNNILLIIQKVLSSENFFIPQMNSLNNLINQSYFEDKRFCHFSPNVIQILKMIPPENSHRYIYILHEYPPEFFTETFQDIISTISTILSAEQYPIGSKYFILELLTSLIKSSFGSNFENPEIYGPIVQSISTLFAQVELDIDLGLNKSGQQVLYELCNTINEYEFEGNCLSLAVNLLHNKNGNIRFSGLTIFLSILPLLEEDEIMGTIQEVVILIEDPSDLSRKTVYKIIKEISKTQEKLFANCLHQNLFPLIFNSIVKEPSPLIATYAFKKLSTIISNCGSEILGLYYQQILELCSKYPTGNIDIQLSIIDCIKYLCSSMKEHLLDSYPMIKEYIIMLASSDNFIIRYKIVDTIPHICKILPYKSEYLNEQISLAHFGISLFAQIYEFENFTELQQLNLFEAFRSLIKIVNFNDSLLEFFNNIVASLFSCARQRIVPQLMDEIDFVELPEKSGIIPYKLAGKIIYCSYEQISSVQFSFDILMDLIEDFPEHFIPMNNDLLNLVVGSTKQFYNINRHLKLLDLLIKKSAILGYSYTQFLNILDTIFSSCDVVNLIIILKDMVYVFNNPDLIQPLTQMADKSLDNIKNKKSELTDVYNSKIENATEKFEKDIIDDYEILQENECLISEFYSFLIKRFPVILNETFIEYIRSRFYNEKFVLPFLIIETQIQIFTTKDFSNILGNFIKVLDGNDRFKICLFALESIESIIKEIDNSDVLIQLQHPLIIVLNYEDNFIDENPSMTNKALYCLALLFKKLPPSVNEVTLDLFIRFLPADDDNRSFIHNCFASLLKSNGDFFISNDNLSITLEIIAQICNSRSTDEETKNTIRLFTQSILAQQAGNEFIANCFKEMKSLYVERLIKFAS